MSKSIESVQFGNQTGLKKETFGATEGNRVSAASRDGRKANPLSGGGDIKISDPLKAPKKKLPNDFFGAWAAAWDGADSSPNFAEENLF